MTAAKQPVVFISYSHLDEPDPLLSPGEDRWLTYVVSHLKPAAAHGKLEMWDDRKIDGGGNWRKDIEQIIVAHDTMRDGGHAQFAEYFERHIPEARALLDRL